LTGLNLISAFEVKAEAIAVTEQTGSLTISPHYFEEEIGPAKKRFPEWGLATTPVLRGEEESPVRFP
jgi:hypothetical protein